MSIILCMSFCIVLFAYFLSMLITAILLSRSCPIVNLKNVLVRWRALKDLSAEHEVAGIVARMEVTLYRTGEMLWRPFWCMVFTITAAFFLWHGSSQDRSFQRLTSHLIAFHYIRHRNLIQFGCCSCLENSSLRGRRSKGKGKGIRARDHTRGRRAPLVFLSRLKLPFPKLPFPSLSNACHAG